MLLVEYCASRAEPAVKDSQYLRHVGEHLLPDIDIMWTGRRIITCGISVKKKAIIIIANVLRSGLICLSD